MMKYRWLLGLGVLLLLVESRAGSVAEDFATIPRNNVFRLSSPKAEQKPVEIQPELPQITLQGLTTLLDALQALLKIHTKAKPAAKEVCCILSEGQTRDGVKVLRIDMESGTVWLMNQGAEQVLVIKR